MYVYSYIANELLAQTRANIGSTTTLEQSFLLLDRSPSLTLIGKPPRCITAPGTLSDTQVEDIDRMGQVRHRPV